MAIPVRNTHRRKRGTLSSLACREYKPGLWLLLVFLLTITSSAEETSQSIRHLFVPVHQPETWPKGEREPLAFDEYLQLRAANQPAKRKRRGAHIEWQSLSASFDPARGVLTDGRWLAEVLNGEPILGDNTTSTKEELFRSRLMSLEPLNLPISELKWSDGDAVWGTAPSGEPMLVVDAAARRLEGKFSRQGRRLQRTWQFELSLATATVSELKLRIPTRFTLKCSSGTVRGPLTSGEEGWRLWDVNLGSQSSCEILVIESPSIPPTEPIVVYELTSSYLLREAEIEIQCEINAEVFHTPKATLVFNIPEDLAIYAVGFVGDSRLSWNEVPRVRGQPRQIQVILPEPQIGRLRALQLLGGMTAKWEPAFVLPRIALANGWFTNGRWNVSVDAPLVWRSLNPVGLRLTEVNATSPTTRRMSFTQFLADATLGLEISSPEVRLTSHGLQRLSARETTWRLTSEWLWESNSGVMFGARCRIPAGWEVLDVQSLPESAQSEVRHWDVIKEASGEQVLVIDFATPLEGQAEYRVNVIARRVRLTESDRDVFELPTPLDCRHSEQLLVVQPPPGWRWDSSKEEVLPAPTAMKRLGTPWIELDLWKEDSQHWTASTLLSRSTQIDAPLKPVAAFVRDESQTSNSKLSGNQVSPPVAARAAEHNVPPTELNAAFREASTEQLVWTSADLRSLIFPGGDGYDVHVLTLKAAQVARVGRLEFNLPSPAELVSVRMNGVRTEPQQSDRSFRLPDIPLGGLQSLEITYRLPSDRDFLRNRQSIPVPRVEAPVLGFRWVFAFPPDARLTEEPSGLRLLQPLEPTPWSRRFFGPLGREQSQELFNPFSSKAWRELWEPVNVPTRDNASLETLFAPPGWRVREAVAATLPTEISWLTWSGSEVRTLAWVGMLLSVSIGCLLRVRRAKPRVHIAAFWLGLCAVGVMLSAPVYAEVLGGCFIGAVIAVLIPRRVVMSYADQRAAAGRGAFEATVAFQRIVGTLILVAFLLSSLEAQEPASSSNDAPTGQSSFDVLIPVDNPLDATREIVRPSEKLPLAFVPKELLHRWRERSVRSVAPSSLTESARYEVNCQGEAATSIRAEFLVHRLRPQEPLTLRFPFTTVPLAGANACLVDGHPHAIAVSSDQDALLLELPALPPTKPSEVKADADMESVDGDQRTFPSQPPIITHRVIFSLLPATSIEEGQQRVKLEIPPVLASDIVVKSLPMAEVELATRRGEAHANIAAGVWSAQLGKQTDWSLDVLRPGTVRQRRPPEVKADVACLADLTPTALRQRYRVRYSVSSGEVNDIAWLLPRGTLLRDGDVTADGLLQWSSELQADGRQRLILEFNRPKTGEFVVDVAGLQPPLTANSTELLRWEPWTIDADRTLSGAGRIALGITSTPGFKVAAPAETERSTPLSEAAFLKSWGMTGLTRQPQVILQVNSPTEFSFALTPLMPRRKVRQELLLKFGRRAFEWALYSEVTTATSPAFQHDVTLAPHFRADEVSVTEDEAERLVSWTQNDRGLSLFLRDSTLGIQNVVLQGRDAIPADGRLVVPTHWFANSEVTDFAVRVTHDPSWQVEMFDDRQQPLNATDPGGSLPDQPDLVLGKFRADPNATSFNLRLTPHQPAGHAAGWTQVSLTPGESWSWRHVERLLDEGQITARVFWPSAWSDNGSVKLSSSLKELARRPLPDGIEITVQSLPDVAGPRELFFESAPAAPPVFTATPSTPTVVRVIPPTSLDIAERTHYWLIDEQLSSWLPASISGEARTFSDLTSLPEKLGGGGETADSVHWISIPSVPVLEIDQPAPASATPSPKLLWMDSTIWVADGAITQGLTWLVLQPHGLRELTMDRPDHAQWIAAFVGDKSQALPAAAEKFLRLGELPNEPVLWISIFWRLDAAQQDRIVARRDTRLPMPTDTTLRPPHHDLTLVSSGHSNLSSTRGARRVQDWSSRLERAASILGALPTNPTALTPPLRRLWGIAENELSEARQMIEQSSNAGLSGSSARTVSTANEPSVPTNESPGERLKNVLSEAAVVRSRLTPSITNSGPLGMTESWTSDAWHSIPDSWNAIAELDRSARLSIIVVDRRWLSWMTALFAAVIVIPLFRGWLKWQTGEWLAEHPQLAWACLGAIWWTCLAPSLIGFGLLVFAFAVAIRNRWTPKVNVPTPA